MARNTNRKPGPVTVVQAAPTQAPTQATPAPAFANIAATLAAGLATASTAAQVRQAQPVVAVRGGLAIAAVTLTGKP
jgi:hypothetical protein